MGFFFGPWKLDPRELFFLRYGVMAFVNYKPVVPGHILIAPVRVVDKFTATSDDELVEMWKLARRIGGLMEGTLYAGSVSAVTYVIQDGADAGQTVPHVHIHVLPRRKGDFARNDEIYDALESGQKGVDGKAKQPPRTVDDMAAEAEMLRRHFSDSDPIPSA